MEILPKSQAGNTTEFIRQAESARGLLQSKYTSGKKRTNYDILGIILLGICVINILFKNTAFNEVDFDAFTLSTEGASEEVVKNVLRKMLEEEFRTQKIPNAAQKTELDAFSKSLSPKWQEVQIKDVLIALGLKSKLHPEIAGYVKKTTASFDDDVLNHERKFKQRSKTKCDLAVSRKSTQFANKGAKSSIVSESSAVTAFPALKAKDVPPFVQKIDSSGTHGQSPNREFSSRTVGNLKEKAKALLQEDNVPKEAEHVCRSSAGILMKVHQPLTGVGQGLKRVLL